MNIREMGSWLERWGRAFHPFAPVGWLIAEQAALPIEWWLHRRRMLEVLARLAVIVPEELTARPALSGAWSRRELVTHRELMSWLSCSRPVVQFSTLSMAAGSTTFAAMAVEGNLAGTEGGEGKPDSKKVDVLGRRRALRDVVPKLEPIAAEYFAQSEPLRQALNKVMRPGEQKWETFLFDAAAHFSARDSDGRVVPDRHYHHSAHTPPQIARYVLGQMIEAAANGNWAMVKELRNRLRDDEPDADAIAQTEFGGLAEVLLYLCRLEQRPELVNKINRVMEEAGVTLGNDTLGEIQRAGIAHSIMIKRVLAIWANTDPIMFVCRTPDGMLVTPEWVVEPTKEQDTKRENLSDAESAPAKEANAKRGGPPKTTVETDSCTHGLLLLADAQRKSEKPSVTQLADTMGVTRQSLYENKDFAPVRDMANKLFGLFGKEAKRGEWQGPRGSKSKDGTVEAVDSADDSDN